MAHILVVDDEKNYRIVLAKLLTDAGHRVSVAENPFTALDFLRQDTADLILSDLRMPGMDGMAFLQKIRAEEIEVPFIIMTAFATVDTALQAMKTGAFDYLKKPFKNDEILVVVEKALDFRRLQAENILLRRQLDSVWGQDIVGVSRGVKDLLKEIEQVAPAPSSVLITGESGTGKELVARALHNASPRSAAALVALNCAAFAENLLESELFGHERGAFTGAIERKRGLLEMADGGTLFLDEIGEMPLSLQPKLLRLLQEKKFRRVGGTAEISCDVRLIAATNRDLENLIETGQFRDDLYYRLNVIQLRIPPLRERTEDIPVLALYFLQRFSRELGRPVAGFTSETLERLKQYSWPGNVRELQNVIERGVLYCRGEHFSPAELPDSMRGDVPIQTAPPLSTPEFAKPLPKILEDVEAELIQKAMSQARGVQAQAARLLGISRSNLQYKLRKFGLISD